MRSICSITRFLSCLLVYFRTTFSLYFLYFILSHFQGIKYTSMEIIRNVTSSAQSRVEDVVPSLRKAVREIQSAAPYVPIQMPTKLPTKAPSAAPTSTLSPSSNVA
jgi:hypothetical protein